ncbi:MAG: type II secretion system protein [Planctomycetes bacterium]|nr:type II secretion system protein [Planctomycetota bacterium]
MNATTSSAPCARRGFSLIEVLIVLGVMAIVAGLAIPVMSRTITRTRVAETRNELVALRTAIENYFSDVGEFPPSFVDLEQNESKATGWAGPYATPLISSTSAGDVSLESDAWGQAYVVEVIDISQVVVRSIGPDATDGTSDDITQVIDVTFLRREHSLSELNLLNAAITAAIASGTSGKNPFSSGVKDVISTLVSLSYLPKQSDDQLYYDGWGDLYVEDPEGVSPVVRLKSVHLDPLGAADNSGSSGNGDSGGNSGAGGGRKNGKGWAWGKWK